MTNIRHAIKWEGDWSEIIKWLDELAGGRFNIPFGHKPAIIMNNQNGTLTVSNRRDITKANIGDWVVLGGSGEFSVVKNDHVMAIREALDKKDI